MRYPPPPTLKPIAYSTAAVSGRPRVSRSDRPVAALVGVICGIIGLLLTWRCWLMFSRGTSATFDPGICVAALCFLAVGAMRLLSALGLLEIEWAPWRRRTSHDDE